MNLDNIEFKGEKRWLSNMYPTKIVFDAPQHIKDKFPEFVFDKQVYNSSEHLYQSLKSDSEEWKQLVRDVEKPEKTKLLARKFLTTEDTLFDFFKIREDFHDIKLKVMELCLYLKFTQNEELKEKLIQYDGFIEERNDWKDIFWGTYNGVGENHLGRLLTELRDKLKSH